MFKIEQNKYTMCSNCNLIITFLTTPCETSCHPCEPCKCVISLLQNFPGNILKPIGMLYNAMTVLRQNYTGTMTDPKFTTNPN